MLNKDLVSIGKVAGHHGYKGQVKVIPLTDFPERFYDLKRVIVTSDKKNEWMEIEECRPYKQFFLFKFKEIESMEMAKEYRNAMLQIEENQVYKLPEGYYYHFQLIGLEVLDVEHGVLGKLTEVIETGGANDVYVVKSKQYGEVLIPAIADVIQAVDLDHNVMRVKLLPGLLDIASK